MCILLTIVAVVGSFMAGAWLGYEIGRMPCPRCGGVTDCWCGIFPDDDYDWDSEDQA